MLDLNPETVCRIIDMATEFHAKEGVVIPSDPGDDDDWAMQVLADHSGDMTYQSLREMIGDLEPDQQVCLLALLYLGRGDFGIEEWESALQDAGDEWTENMAESLIAIPMLPDYLREGLRLHGHSCESEY